jgi:hypothetical protein
MPPSADTNMTKTYRNPISSLVDAKPFIMDKKLPEATVFTTELMFRKSSKIPTGGSGPS